MPGLAMAWEDYGKIVVEKKGDKTYETKLNWQMMALLMYGVFHWRAGPTYKREGIFVHFGC